MPQVKGDDGTSSGQGFIRYGVWGDASDGPAVVGTVQSGWGVLGSAIRRRYGQAPGAYYPAYAGVTGYSDRGTGVFGKSDYDVGVSGEGYEVGVRAETFGRGDAGIGVSARDGSIGVQAARQYENDSPDFIGVVAEGGPDGIAGYFENATIRRGS